MDFISSFWMFRKLLEGPCAPQHLLYHTNPWSTCIDIISISGVYYLFTDSILGNGYVQPSYCVCS